MFPLGQDSGGSAAAPECQFIPRERPLNSNSLYQSLRGVFYSQKGVVCPFSPFVNSPMVSLSMLGSQPCFPNMHPANGPALCNSSAVASPQEQGLGAPRLSAVRTWGHRDNLLVQWNLAQKVSMMPHREWRKSSPALSTSSFHQQQN